MRQNNGYTIINRSVLRQIDQAIDEGAKGKGQHYDRAYARLLIRMLAQHAFWETQPDRPFGIGQWCTTYQELTDLMGLKNKKQAERLTKSVLMNTSLMSLEINELRPHANVKPSQGAVNRPKRSSKSVPRGIVLTLLCYRELCRTENVKPSDTNAVNRPVNTKLSDSKELKKKKEKRKKKELTEEELCMFLSPAQKAQQQNHDTTAEPTAHPTTRHQHNRGDLPVEPAVHPPQETPNTTHPTSEATPEADPQAQYTNQPPNPDPDHQESKASGLENGTSRPIADHEPQRHNQPTRIDTPIKQAKHGTGLVSRPSMKLEQARLQVTTESLLKSCLNMFNKMGVEAFYSNGITQLKKLNTGKHGQIDPQTNATPLYNTVRDLERSGARFASFSKAIEAVEAKLAQPAQQANASDIVRSA